MTAVPLDPLMAELFRRLPPAGLPWPVADQVVWFRAFIAIADLIYGPTERAIVVAAVASSDLNAARDAGMREGR